VGLVQNECFLSQECCKLKAYETMCVYSCVGIWYWSNKDLCK